MILLTLLLGAALGSGLPVWLARNEREHADYSISMLIACSAGVIVTGMILLLSE